MTHYKYDTLKDNIISISYIPKPISIDHRHMEQQWKIIILYKLISHSFPKDTSDFIRHYCSCSYVIILLVLLLLVVTE